MANLPFGALRWQHKHQHKHQGRCPEPHKNKPSPPQAAPRQSTPRTWRCSESSRPLAALQGEQQRGIRYLHLLLLLLILLPPSY
jgi:hypothetical protein